MATEDNLRDRAKEIRGAFEPSSVTNEAVGGLLLDIINFFIDYGGNGGGGGKPDARYWSKEELKMLDQYLYVLGDKIKSIYADNAGDSELFEGHSWKDHFDQPLRTFDPVKFNSVTSTDFESKLKGWVIDALGNAEFRDVLLRSFKSWNFAAGPLGAGVGMVNDDELQTDKLLVRKIMYVLEMMIQRMRFQGGIMVLSPATGFKIDRVETFDTYYRVYCRPEDFNEFEVNDQARIQNFTGNNIKYLWSLVLSRGDDYIDISRVDKDGDGVPAEGDEIVQLGNRTNPDRQDAVLLSAVNGEVGIFTYYGINNFDLSSKEGSWLGKHGGKKGAVIRGEVHITAGSSGLEQFDEYEDVDKRIQDAKDLADSVQDVVNNLTSIIIPDIQGQIDGSIMSHEGKVPPTLTNEPAVNWTTEEEKNRHLGDYYDYFLTVDGEQVTERYKFSKVNGAYQWVRVADSGSALAASVAREALGLAGTKATITWGNTLPEAPYNINDMWIKLDGSMYICNHQRLDGETGSQSDWQLFNDTMLRLAKMADDNFITKEEKATLRDTWNQIQKEFTAYQAQATKYGVSITALQNAYNTLNTFLTNTVKIAQDIDSNLSVAQKTEYNQDFANYYSERTAFANVIAQKVADESVGNLQIGMVNLLKGSNVESNNQSYLLGAYIYDTKPEIGKEYTLVVCYTLGSNNTRIEAYINGGAGSAVASFSKTGDRIIESKKFTARITPIYNFNFYQFPNGTYGSKVHWAVLVEGNKGPNSWIPSQADNDAKAQAIAKAEAELAEVKANAYADGIVTEAEQNAINEAQARLDALKIGSVNLVSRKMMLDWNNKVSGIATWGQDSDGIYLKWNLRLMENKGLVTKLQSNITNAPDLFIGNYKANTQYVFSIQSKNTDNSGSITFFVIYTDGSMSYIAPSRTYGRKDLVTDKGKSIKKIVCYISYFNDPLVYDIALYEGNKVLSEPPVATEDLTGQSNVNLVDGGKEVTVESEKLNYEHKSLLVPKLKPNTVYYLSFKAEMLKGSLDTYSTYLYNEDNSTGLSQMLNSLSGGIMITNNNFTEGSYSLLLYAGKAGSTFGHSVKYTDVMLVEGFTPPSSYSPSPGDVAKDIKDVSDAVANLNTTINTTFKDGIISEAEAQAIASNINVLNAEKADIDAYYTKLYANAYLTGTAKTNLASAKTAYNTAHTKLIDSINTAIADGKTTATEKADVDDKFSAYNNALSAYQTRVGEANKAIQDQIKALAEQDATNKVNGIQIGVRNLLLDSGGEVTNGSYNIKNYNTSIPLLPSKKYTVVIRGTTTGGQTLGLWFNGGSNGGGMFPSNMTDEVAFIHTTSPSVLNIKDYINFYNYPSSGSAANPATIKWACLYEGHVKPPLDWVQAPEDITDRLAEWASDNYISPQEKTALRQQKSDIQSEYNDIVANANRYNISLTSYTTAYNAAISALTKYTATSPENIAVSSDYNNISAYYTARQTILNSIAAAAKAQVDGVVDTIDKVTTEFNTKIDQKADSVTVSAMRTDLNSLGQVVSQQGSKIDVNTGSIDMIVTKNGSGTIVSIKPEMVEITGATVIKDGNGNKVNIFGIGDKVISVNGGVFSVDKAGKVIMQNAEIAGKITAKTGEIGSFTIDGIWLKGSELRISGSQITFENGNNRVYLNSHPDMATGGAVKLGTFVLTGGSYNGLESARAVALIAAAPSDNYSCAIAVTSGRVLMKGQIHFDNVVTYTGSGAVTITADSGHFIYLTPITGNPVVSVSSGLPIGSWFIIAHATTAGGFYYIKLNGSDRFRRRGNAYQQVNSNNQDPSLIFKVNNTTWIIGNLPVNWIDWN